MNDDPAPETTLSDEDAEVLADETWGIYRGEREDRIERIIRDLDARLALSLANQRGAEYEIREVRADNALII